MKSIGISSEKIHKVRTDKGVTEQFQEQLEDDLTTAKAQEISHTLDSPIGLWSKLDLDINSPMKKLSKSEAR